LLHVETGADLDLVARVRHRERRVDVVIRRREARHVVVIDDQDVCTRGRDDEQRAEHASGDMDDLTPKHDRGSPSSWARGTRGAPHVSSSPARTKASSGRQWPPVPGGFSPFSAACTPWMISRALRDLSVTRCMSSSVIRSIWNAPFVFWMSC